MASRAVPIPGPMAEQGSRAAMADQGIRAAMADQGTRAAMVDPGTRAAIPDPELRRPCRIRGPGELRGHGAL